MKTIHLSAIAGIILCVAPMLTVRALEPEAAKASVTMPIWPAGKMPGKAPDGKEHELPSRGDNVIRITDVNEPSIAVFKAPGKDKTTPAVIVCPGGGYGVLAYDKEGTEIATWLNTIGITAVVLKYRVPKNQDGAYQDIQRAMRLVRHNAAAWNITPDRVGVMGFSAGGHLCARLSTNYDQSAYPKLDDADDEKLRPDFAVLVYPAYLVQTPGKLAKGLVVTEKTPPTFMVHTEDDKTFIAGSKAYHEALEAAKVSNEYYLCATGGHGYGMRAKSDVNLWPKKCQEWLVKSKLQ